MAFNIIYMEILDSSDEEENINALPPLGTFVIENNNEHKEIQMLYPLFESLKKIEHIKVPNYIETIVYNYNNADFIMHFRLSKAVAYELIHKFEISDIYTCIQDRAEHLKVTAEKHILCFLWFVGHESGSYRDVADRFGIAISTLYHIITRVTEFIMFLAPNIIRYPTSEEKEETASYFLQEKGFPHVIGAIDGSHVRIDKPIEDGDSYINRKQYFSLHIQGTVNHKYQFMDVFIGYPGSVHDARVFKNSSIYNDLRELCGDKYILLGDSAYPCLFQVIVPYKDNGHLTRKQKMFNRKLSSCRVVIENAFGILKQRFRQLYHFKLRDIPRMVRVIHACCVLHNIANIKDLELFETPINDDQPDILAQNNYICDDEVREYETGMDKRNDICHEITC